MPERFKVLGQVAPATAYAATDLYTVHATEVLGAAVSTLSVCNTTAAQRRFRVAVRPAGAAVELKHWLYYDALIGPNVTVAVTIGMTLAPTDVVTAYADDAGLALTLFGTEVLPEVEA